MNLVLIGPQGSGKGAQAELLSTKFKIPTVSVGQLYREQIRKQTALGKKVKKYVLSGALVPNNFTNNLIESELGKKKYAKGFILDGFPRDLVQARFLEKVRKIDKVILITISQSETIKRLSGRRVCDCGETYHIITKKPKRNMVCDKCGRSLKQRPDDTPKAIKARLKIYHQQTKSVIAYFNRQGKVIKINGQANIRQVFKRILKVLKK